MLWIFFFILLTDIFFYSYLEEEIDGITLEKLPFDELRTLFPKLKERILFTEQRDLLVKKCNDTAHEQLHGEGGLSECNKQTLDICSESQITTATQDLLDDTPPQPPPCTDMDTEIFETTSSINGQVNEDERDDLEEQQQELPLDFEFSSIPEEIQMIVNENEITKLRGHTNHRRILLNFVFKTIGCTYNLLYRKRKLYTFRIKFYLLLL